MRARRGGADGAGAHLLAHGLALLLHHGVLGAARLRLLDRDAKRCGSFFEPVDITRRLALLPRVCFDGKHGLLKARELEFEVAMSMELRLK